MTDIRASVIPPASSQDREEPEIGDEDDIPSDGPTGEDPPAPLEDPRPDRVPPITEPGKPQKQQLRQASGRSSAAP